MPPFDPWSHSRQTLREEHKVDVVVALTHMRQPNDIILAESVAGIDLVLGGHDHFYAVTQCGTCTVVKSGTDFREFSVVDVSQWESRTRAHLNPHFWSAADDH